MLMRRKTGVVFVVSIMIMIIGLSQVEAARTPTATVIPPIPSVASGVIFQCSPLVAFPGSVVTGSSGAILVSCGNNGAVILDGTLTPSFVLPLGYNVSAIVLHPAFGNPCSFRFRSLTVGNFTVPTGHFLNQTLSFSSNPVQGQMLTAVYDYCLGYKNVPVNGLAGFNIVWT